MESTKAKENTEANDKYRLSRLTDEILRQSGFDIFGRAIKDSNYRQIIFEARIKTGAYCGKSSRR